nr:protein Daple-like [Ipomoea batatas]
MPQPSTTNHAPFTASPSFSRFASTSSMPLDLLVFANTTTRLFSDQRDTLDVRSSSSNLTNRLTSPQRNRSVSPPNRSTSNQVLDPIAFRHLPSKIFELEMRSMVESLGPKVSLKLSWARQFFPLQISLLNHKRPGRFQRYAPSALKASLHGFHKPSMRNMVPATRHFWMDYTPSETLTSHLVGDTMHAAMKVVALHKRVTEISKEVPFGSGKRQTTLCEHRMCALSLACPLYYSLGWPPLYVKRAYGGCLGDWQRGQDYRHFTSPPSIQVFQDWVRTPGGRATMTSISEVWLRDTDEGRAYIVREGEDA